ncbi:MAG: hypothetical protein K8T25_15685 [Planctomycetia bacterium]|nr:hypothetical protein [Planctomycetia bacterium]
MLWSIEIQSDADNPTVGTGVASYTDESGAVFTFPAVRAAQADVENEEKLAAWVVTMKQHLAAAQAQRALEAQLRTTVEAALNAD